MTRAIRPRPDLFASADAREPFDERMGSSGGESDASLSEDIRATLASDSGHWDALEVHVAAGEVTLRGVVTSLGVKFDAERIVHRVPGVRDVANELRVASDAKSE